jgi:hypothetical protein
MKASGQQVAASRMGSVQSDARLRITDGHRANPDTTGVDDGRCYLTRGTHAP